MGTIIAGTAVNTGSPAYSTSTTAGSTLVAVLGSNSGSGTNDITTSTTGWTQVIASGVSFGWISMWEKVNCGTGEAAPVFTSGGSDLWSRLFELQGAATISPADQSAGTSSVSSTPSVTLASADTIASEFLITATYWNGSNTGGTLTLATFKDSTGATVSSANFTQGANGATYFGSTAGITSATTGGSSDTSSMTNSVFSNGVQILGTFKPGAGPVAPPPPLPQPGGKAWRNRHRRRQQMVMAPPASSTTLTVNAGLATATGTAWSPSVPSSGPLARDASSPVSNATDDPGTQVATQVSNAFSPPAGSVIVVNAVALSSGVADWSTTPFAITDSLGSHLSWNLSVDQYDNTDSQYSERIAVFWAYCPSAQTGMTVSVTVGVNDPAQYIFGFDCKPDVWTGAKSSGPIGTVINGTAASTSTLSESITPTATGSALMLYGGPTFDPTANPTAGTGCYGANPGSAAVYFLGEWFGTSSGPTLTTSTSPQTMTMTFTGPQTWQYVGYEILAGAASPVSAGLASGTGTAQSPTVTLVVNAGLATGTGTAQSPAASLTIAAQLATGTGTAQSPVDSLKVNASLATGTGTAQSPAASLTVSAGLATGTGTAQSPAVTATVNAGLATGTGTSQPPTVSSSGTVNAGLATGTGTAQSPTVTLTVNAGLATGTGTAQSPGAGARTAGLATGTGTAQSPKVTLAVNVGLATGTGTAQSPATTVKLAAGLATGTGTAFNVTRYTFTRANVDYTGSTLATVNSLGGTVSVFVLGGTASVNVNNQGGAASVNTNNLGGTVTVFTLGGTASVTSDTLTGTLSVVVNTLSGTDVTDKMQEVDIGLNEFNDATVTFQVKNNGSPMDITGMTVNALFKKAKGDLDSAGTTTTYSSGGGSPAITIVTPSTGSCTLAIPHTDVIFPNWTFYRIDVVASGVSTTAIYGTVTITQL